MPSRYAEKIVHGEYQKSTSQKLVLSFGHAAAVGTAVWLLLGGGLASAGLGTGDAGRRDLLAAASLFYLVRFLITTYVFVRRSMDWSEAIIVLVWLSIIHLVYALSGGSNPDSLGVTAMVGMVLYMVGSFLNTVSEFQRMQWKKRMPGRLYTGGLFRLSRHVNYFGDAVLFTGFALLTGSPWSLIVPALMTGMFLFLHAPNIEKYLETRYGDDFREWSSKTAMFIPFVY